MPWGHVAPYLLPAVNVCNLEPLNDADEEEDAEEVIVEVDLYRIRVYEPSQRRREGAIITLPRLRTQPYPSPSFGISLKQLSKPKQPDPNIVSE